MRRKYFYVFFLFFVWKNFPKAQIAWNVELFGHVMRDDVRYSGSWSYVAPDGSEYALIGAKTGTAVYSIDDPAHIQEMGFIPGPETNWREITTLGDHAFVVTDASGTGHAMQVIDLGYLPDSIHLLTSYTATFTKGHIIQKAIDNDDPFVYVMGTSTTQGVHILDVTDPANPVETGLYAPGYYIHDAHIRGNLLFAAAFYNPGVDIVDISDKTNPVLVGKITYEGKNTHSASTTEDGKYLILADEADGYPARVFNIEDIGNPVEVAQFTANSASLVHNPYVLGNYCFVSHNTEGLRVLDITDPELPVEVGFYDTWEGASGGFNGLWSACPYFPSGKIIGGNRHDGLYIWTFNQTKAARIYGIVTDSLSGEAIAGAWIEITELADTLTSSFTGHFKKGMTEGHYTLKFSAPGYVSKTIEKELAQGDSIWLAVPLVSQTLNADREAIAGLPSFAVYPNPASHFIQADLSSWPQTRELLLMDEAGTIVWRQDLKGQFQPFVRISGFPAGAYRLVALGKNGKPLTLSGTLIFK